MLLVILLCLGITDIALTISKGKIFGAFRRWIKRRSSFLGDLFSCPYCLSHWLCAATAWIFGIRVVPGSAVISFLGTTFVMSGIVLFMIALAMLIIGDRSIDDEMIAALKSAKNRIKVLEEENRDLSVENYKLRNKKQKHEHSKKS